MKNLITVLILSGFLSGCSLLPKINFDTPNTVPQVVDKSKVKDICKGETKVDETGRIIYCSKGYYSYSENYAKKERRNTMKEKIINFFRNLSGWAFWIAVALLIFCPSVLGLLVGRIIEGIFGIARKSLSATVRPVQNARKNGKDLDDALASEQDSNVKKFIRKLKDEENI